MAALGGAGGPSPTTPFAAPLALDPLEWPAPGAGPNPPSRGALRWQAPEAIPAPACKPDGGPTFAGFSDGSPAVACTPDGAPALGRGHPSAGGPPSFAQVLLHSFRPLAAPFPVHPPAHTDAGEPAAFFTLEEVNMSCKPLQTAVIARTPQGRPPFPEIRAHLVQRFKLQQDFVISSLDKRHLLIRFQNSEDFLQVLLKETMLVQGRPFWFFRWSMDFCPETDSPVVPLWMELPQLPANFFTEPMVRSIAGSIGPVLKVDKNTLNLTCTQAARANVQLDVSKALPERIWIGHGSKGFWQPITYPDPPLFCSSCRRLGHLPSKCKKSAARSHQEPDGTVPEQSPPNAKSVNEKGVGQAGKLLWRPIATNDVISTTHGSQQGQTPAKGAETNTAQHMFDIMLKQQLPSDSAMGAAPDDQREGPHPTLTHDTSDGDDDSPPNITHRSVGVMHIQRSPPDPITAPSAPKLPLERVINAHVAKSIDAAPVQHESPRTAANIASDTRDETSKAKTDYAVLPPYSTDALQELDGMPHPGEQSKVAAAPPNDDGHPQHLSIPVSKECRTATHEAPPPCTPEYAAPSTTTQQETAPFAPKVKGIPHSVLNDEAPPWTTPQCSGQQAEHPTPSVKGAVLTASPSGIETSASPSSPCTSSPAARANLLAEFVEILKDAPAEDTPPSTEERRSAPPATPPERITKPPPTTPGVFFADSPQYRAMGRNMNRRKNRYFPWRETKWRTADDLETPRPGPSTQPE